MYYEVYLKKRGLLPGTSCTTAIHGDNPLEEGLKTVFIAIGIAILMGEGEQYS